MTDIEKIKQAETYISTIEKDFDPVNGGFLNPDDLLTNERMKKCLSPLPDRRAVCTAHRIRTDRRYKVPCR